MATINGYTAERMQEIEDTTVVGGSVNSNGSLILSTRQGAKLDAGLVKGAKGDTGPIAPLVAGIISQFAGTTPPMGWFMCNGATISRANYPELFAAIGTTYGAGDGSTTFILPDFRGRVPVGFDVAQTEFDVLGEMGGTKTHTLTTAEIPSHTHTIRGYSGIDDSNFTGNGTGAYQANDAPFNVYNNETNATGGGQPHNNLQPYSVTNYIISIGTSAAVAGGVPIAAQYLGRGTSAERDAIYGVPGTDTQRVDLANRKIVWYNTTTNRFETYYATKTLTGLTATGIVGASGWYQELTSVTHKVTIPTPANNTLADAITVTRTGGIVTLQGRTTRNGGGTAWLPVGAIPLGFRPVSAAVFPQWAVNALGVLGQVNPDGSAVTPFSSATGDFMATATWATDPTIAPF